MKLLLMLMLIIGCGKTEKVKTDLEFTPNKQPVEQRDVSDRVEKPEIVKTTFKDLKEKILAPKNCLQCHGFLNDEKMVLNLVSPGNPESSKLYQIVENGRMPIGMGPLSTKELEIVENYILGL